MNDADAVTQTTIVPLNKLSVLAVACAVVALAALVFLGLSATAVFAVGCGHLALQQLSTGQQRGHLLARLALVVGYGIGIFALLSAAGSLLWR